MQRPLRFPRLWLGLGWLLVLATVTFSLMPAPPEGPTLINDKVLHASIYFVLASWFAGIYLSSRYLRIAVLLLLLGGAIELLQLVGGARMGEWLDMLANAAGILAGLVLARLGLAGWCGWMERLVPGGARA